MELKYFIDEINSMRIHESNNDLSEWGKNKLNEYEFILTELSELKKLRVTDVSGRSELLIEFAKFIQKYKNKGLDYDCIEREVADFLNQ